MTNDDIAADAARRVAAQMFDYAGRKETIIKAIEDALTESRRARIGDSEIIGREMCRAEKAEADAKTLKTELAEAVEAYRMKADAYERMRVAYESCRMLNPVPAPSGWQQRIAAMLEQLRFLEPAGHDGDEETGEHYNYCQACAYDALKANLESLADAGQHAKDDVAG